MPSEIPSEQQEMWHANKAPQPKKTGQANSSNLDVSIFTVTGEFYLIFVFFLLKRGGPPACSLARPPPQTFLWDGVTDSFTRHRPLTCPNTASEKLKGRSGPKNTRLEKGGWAFCRAGPDRTRLAESYGQGGAVIWPSDQRIIQKYSQVLRSSLQVNGEDNTEGGDQITWDVFLFMYNCLRCALFACLISQHTVVHDYDHLFIWLIFSVHVVATVPFRALFSACRSNVWPVLAMVTLLFVEPSGHCWWWRCCSSLSSLLVFTSSFFLLLLFLDSWLRTQPVYLRAPMRMRL